MAERLQRLADTEEGVFQAGEFDFRAGEIQFGSEDLEIGMPGSLKQVEGPGLSEEYGVQTFARNMFQAQAAGGVGLGIEVDQEDPLTGFGRSGSQMDGGGGFAHPPLLIYDGHNAHKEGKRRGGWVVETIRRIGSLDLWERIPIF